MKKILIGSIVGAILLFAWSSLSWTVLNIHESEYKYSSAQDSIMSTLAAHIKEDGQYFMPNLPPGATMEAMEAYAKEQENKPWALVTFHSKHEIDMVMPIIRGFFICLVCVILVCWVLQRLGKRSFYSVFMTVMSFAAICFLFVWYNGHNWFHTPWSVLRPELIDLVVGWGITALWLGWWYSRKAANN